MTDDDEIARQARYLTTQAKEDGVEYVHNSVGYNYRMNNVLAAIGVAQLESLDERLVIKRANFADMKRELLDACAAAGVQVRPLWYLNHLQEPYREMQAHRIERAPQFYDTVLNLPCSVSLTPHQIAEVVALVKAADPRRQATPA